MLFKEFAASPKTIDILEEYLLPIKRLNFFAILLDLASLKADERAELKYDAAGRALWHEGYVEALRDVFEFSERYKKDSESRKTKMPRADFGAVEDLFNKGEITEDERNQLRNEYTNFYGSKG